MSYSDFRETGTPPARAEWWRTYLAQKSRRIAEHRMRWFYALGFLMIAVAAVFLIPMLLAR